MKAPASETNQQLNSIPVDPELVPGARNAVQVGPTRKLARALAYEWQAQGEDIDPKDFLLRDLADYALDVVAGDPAAAVSALLPFAETDFAALAPALDIDFHRRFGERKE